MSSRTEIQSVSTEDDALKLLLRLASLQLSPILPASAELESLNYLPPAQPLRLSFKTISQAASLYVLQPRKLLTLSSYGAMFT